MNELVFFEIPKQNLKIQIVKKSDEILEQIRKESAETAVMPDVALHGYLFSKSTFRQAIYIFLHRAFFGRQNGLWG